MANINGGEYASIDSAKKQSAEIESSFPAYHSGVEEPSHTNGDNETSELHIEDAIGTRNEEHHTIIVSPDTVMCLSTLLTTRDLLTTLTPTK